MLFNYILYFLVVLFLYLGYQPIGEPSGETAHWGLSLGLIGLGYAAFFAASLAALKRAAGPVSLARRENRLIFLAVGLYAVDIYFFRLKDLTWLIPGTAEFSAWDGLIGLAFFYLYLLLLWIASWPMHRRWTTPEGDLKSHLIAQTRWTLPLVLPWFILTLTNDAIWALTPERWRGVLASPLAYLGLVAVTLAVLSLILPPLVKFSWGCTPLPAGPRREGIAALLAAHRVRVGEILLWPVLQGRVITAGVMGIVPRLRYLLVTPSLLESLSPGEIEAVLAHECGHVKYRHLPLYVLFFIGFLAASFALSELAATYFVRWDVGARWLLNTSRNFAGWLPAIKALPLLILMVVYFRFVFAWFMRNFERQADAYAVSTCGPGPVITALERIAALSGIDRKAPSWHHFSIAQRVQFVLEAGRTPGLIDDHSRRLKRALWGYLACLVLILAVAWPAGVFKGEDEFRLRLQLAEINRIVEAYPDDSRPHLARAMILYRLGEYAEAAEAYRRTLALDPENAGALNDLAWLLTTGPEELRDLETAVRLAERAVKLEREAAFLDTLAEVYHRLGRTAEALPLAKEALAKAKERREYYQAQAAKFERALAENQSR